MVKEKMAELKIIVPTRWLNFIDDYYQVTGVDRKEDMMSTMESIIRGFMIENDHLSLKDRIRLVEKHKLKDIHPIAQWERDEAAGIKRKPEPIPQITQVKDPVASEALAESLAPFAVKVAWKLLNGMTLEEIERFKSLTQEELDERLKVPLPHCSEDSTGVPA
jgi:hypothetical protein